MEPETQHLIGVLKNAIEAAGLRNGGVERTLRMSPGYLSRLFSGKIALRFEHIVKIAGAVGLTPAEVFQSLYPVAEDPPTPAMVLLQEALRCLKPPPPPAPGWTAEERATFERHLETSLRQALGRLRLSLDPRPAPEPSS
jgi:transcriptional regulator with XRE-family HTH domain